MEGMPIWVFIIIVFGALLTGAVVAFFVTRSIITKQIEKNPPINRDMIRAMYMQMGRKPSESDISRVMNSMNKYKTPDPKEIRKEERKAKKNK